MKMAIECWNEKNSDIPNGTFAYTHQRIFFSIARSTHLFNVMTAMIILHAYNVKDVSTIFIFFKPVIWESNTTFFVTW